MISAAFGVCEAPGTTAYLKAPEDHKVRSPDRWKKQEVSFKGGRGLLDTGGGMIANQVGEPRVGEGNRVEGTRPKRRN